MSNLSAYLNDVGIDLTNSEINSLLQASALELSDFCDEYGCDSAFFQALFYDNFPDLVDLIILDEQTDRMMSVSEYVQDLSFKSDFCFQQ